VFKYVQWYSLIIVEIHEVNGKPTIVDPDTNRPIYIGDGIVPQVERFANKYAYAKLTN
jgi:hypothetical protein